jgi:hypothetical protein
MKLRAQLEALSRSFTAPTHDVPASRCCAPGNRVSTPRPTARNWGAGVDVFVTRHLHLQNIVLQFELDISSGSRHDAVVNILFLQLR